MPLWAQITLHCLTLLVAVSAGVASKRAFESSASLKWRRETDALITDLNSNFDSLLESHKRLRSRTGMQELRARRTPMTKAETKAELLARVGLAGKSGPEFARAQLNLDADN